jgi:hypothetical protein
MVRAMRGLMILLACGCGRLGFDQVASSRDATTSGDDGAPSGSDGAMPGDATGDGSMATGSGSIDGTAPDGKPFTTLVTGYIIGHPKYAQETAIYMFSGPIKCSDISYRGWGQWITAGTQCMEFQLPARVTGMFSVEGSQEPPPSPSGFSRYRYGEGGGGELTGTANGGTLMITSADADAISGTFMVTFDLHGPLTGTFTAVECPGGYYPTFP